MTQAENERAARARLAEADRPSPVLHARVSARSLRRGAPAGFLPRALALSFVLHGAALGGLFLLGDPWDGGTPREVHAAELRVARAEPEVVLEEPAEPEWTLEAQLLDTARDELPEPVEVEPVDEPAPQVEPALDAPWVESARGFERLPLEPFARPASLEPEPSATEPELQVADPEPDGDDPQAAEPIDETLVLGVAETEPVLIDGPAPSYPPLALRQGWEGTTVVRIRVAADGRVAGVEVERTSGHELLDDAALQAIRGWRFAAGTRGGLARASELLHQVRFRLVDTRR